MHFVTGSRDDAVARGELSLVDVADSVLVSVCPSLPYVAVDGFPKCLPHFILEGVYARVLVPRVDVLTYEMGVSSLAIEAFTKIEAHLKTLNARQEFSFAVASYSEFIMRLTELPLDGALELAPDEVVSNEILLMPDPDEYWPGDITFEDLTDSVGRLSPFGNLALLLGPRTLTESRTMRPRADGSVSRFASVFVPIQKAARSLDGLDKAPDPPGDGSTVLQEPADKPDVLGAVGNWLKTNCLPYELEVPLVTERIARHQVLLIKQYASDKGESVIRARFDSFIAVFPHLYRVLKGNIVTIQLEFARALAAKLVPDTKLDSVAAYHALETAASKLTYILDATTAPIRLPTVDAMNEADVFNQIRLFERLSVAKFAVIHRTEDPISVLRVVEVIHVDTEGEEFGGWYWIHNKVARHYDAERPMKQMTLSPEYSKGGQSGFVNIAAKDRHRYAKVTEVFGNDNVELVATGFNMESGGKVPTPICKKCDLWLRRAARQDQRALVALSEPTEPEQRKIAQLRR